MKKAVLFIFALALALSLWLTAALAADYTVRGFRMESAALAAVPKGEDPYAAPQKAPAGNAAAFARQLEEYDLYFMLDYAMEAADRPTRAPLVLTLRFPSGSRHTYKTTVTFAERAKKAGKGVLAIPCGELFLKRGKPSAGEYTAIVEIAGRTAGKAVLKLSETAADSSGALPENRRAITDFTLEVLSPSTVKIAWPGSANNVSIVYEQDNNRYYLAEEVPQNPAVINSLLPGRTYRFAVGEDVDRVREVFHDDSKYYIDITMPDSDDFAPEGFSIAGTTLFHSVDGFRNHSEEVNFFPISPPSADSSDDSYCIDIDYKAKNMRALPQQVQLTWGLTSPSGSDYSASSSVDFTESTTISLLVNRILSDISVYDSAPEAGTYRFFVYADGMLILERDIEIK